MTTPDVLIGMLERAAPQPPRKWRLIACFAGYLVKGWAGDAANRVIAAIEEAGGDGLPAGALAAMRLELYPSAWEASHGVDRVAYWAAEHDDRAERACRNAVLEMASRVAGHSPDGGAGACRLMREAILDITGRPPIYFPATLALLGGAKQAGALAALAYEGRDYAVMPILADALEEAGCRDRKLLAHLRGGGPHVRGCWALDLLLGKE